MSRCSAHLEAAIGARCTQCAMQCVCVCFFSCSRMWTATARDGQRYRKTPRAAECLATRPCAGLQTLYLHSGVINSCQRVPRTTTCHVVTPRRVGALIRRARIRRMHRCSLHGTSQGTCTCAPLEALSCVDLPWYYSPWRTRTTVHALSSTRVPVMYRRGHHGMLSRAQRRNQSSRTRRAPAPPPPKASASAPGPTCIFFVPVLRSGQAGGRSPCTCTRVGAEGACRNGHAAVAVAS